MVFGRVCKPTVHERKVEAANRLKLSLLQHTPWPFSVMRGIITDLRVKPLQSLFFTPVTGVRAVFHFTAGLPRCTQTRTCTGTSTCRMRRCAAHARTHLQPSPPRHGSAVLKQTGACHPGPPPSGETCHRALLHCL